MNPEHIPILINTGIGGVMLYLYFRLFEHLKSLTEELRQTRQEQWELIVELVGHERAASVRSRVNGT